MSTLVRMPSGCMPANRASPDTPEPVPISTTARACTARASKVRAVAAAAPDRGDAQRLGARPGRPSRSSASGTKFSAYAQDGGLGADLAEVLAGAVTGSA